MRSASSRDDDSAWQYLREENLKVGSGIPGRFLLPKINKERILQPSNDHPPTPGRPSLLSLDQQAEADRHRILAELDEEEAELKTGARGVFRWFAIGGVVAALGFAGGALLLGEEEKPIVPAVVAAAQTMPAPPVQAPSPVGLADAAEGASAAPILVDEPVTAATPPAPVAPLLLESTEALAEPVEHTVAPARAKPAPAIKAAKVAARKKAVKPKPKARERPRASGKKKVVARMPTQGDSEVALLAALVTHSKATAAKTGRIAAKLQHCKSLVAAAQRTCRVRVCAAAKGAAECKTPILGRTASVAP